MEQGKYTTEEDAVCQGGDSLGQKLLLKKTMRLLFRGVI